MAAIKLPHSLPTEEAILGAVLAQPECLRLLVALEVEAFHSPRHQVVWSAIRNLEATLQPIDPFTVAAEIHRMGKSVPFADGGGDGSEEAAVGFLGSLVAGGGSNVESYAATLVKHQVTRATMRTLGHCLEMLNSDHGGLDGLEGEGAVQWCRAQLAAVDAKVRASSISIGKVVEGRLRELQDIEARQARGERVLTGVPSGIAKLDDKIGGYQFEIVTLIGGRPRMGKSSVMMTAMRAATEAGMGAHSFSLEDARSSHADRAVANVANVSVTTARQATMQRAEFAEFMRGCGILKGRKRWRYDDRRGRTAPQLIEAWRREAEENGTRIVAIDYVQRIRPTNPRAPKHEQLEQTVQDLADAAAEDKIALLLGAQLSRGATTRPGGKPTLEDIKASGAIEEIVKCAILVHRGSVYGPPTEGVDYHPDWDAPLDRRPDDDEWASRLDLLVAKNSNGAEGEVWATWTGHRTLAS